MRQKSLLRSGLFVVVVVDSFAYFRSVIHSLFDRANRRSRSRRVAIPIDGTKQRDMHAGYEESKLYRQTLLGERTSKNNTQKQTNLITIPRIKMNKQQQTLALILSSFNTRSLPGL